MDLSTRLNLMLRDIVYPLDMLTLQMTNILLKPFKSNQSKRLKQEIKDRTIKKVLIAVTPGYGDTIVSLRVIRPLLSQFEDATVLAYPRNSQILKEEGIQVLLDQSKPLPLSRYFQKHLWQIYLTIYLLLKSVKSIFWRSKPQFDLVIDLAGDPSIKFRYPSRYLIGSNRRWFSLIYTDWFPTSISTSNMNIVDCHKELIRLCLGLDLKVDDGPPSNFRKQKKKQIFIFVGVVPNRNISNAIWKKTILDLAAIGPCIVADDPLQKVMDQLKVDMDILAMKQITLIIGKRELDALAEIANQSMLIVSIDGGAEHYLERYSNSFVIYTDALPQVWKPFSLNPYRVESLSDDHVYEESITSHGLKKMVFYKGLSRKSTFNFQHNILYYKDLNPGILASQVKKSGLL